MPSIAPTLSTTAALSDSTRGVLLRERFLLFAAVAIACCIASAHGLLRGPALLPIVLGAIAIAMWHGAYDQVQAQQVLAPALGRRWLPVFLVGYAVLGSVTLLGWYLLPQLSLWLFLAYSSWHFGTEPEEATPRLIPAVTAVSFGAVPIVAACVWHASTVEPIFAEMLRGATAPAREAGNLTQALGRLFLPVSAAAAIGIAFGLLGRPWRQRMELGGIVMLELALFRFCDPLLAFAVYFCCWHTPEHLLATSLPVEPGESLRSRAEHNLRAGFIPWLLSLALLGTAFAFGRHLALAYEAEIFIVLSALTVPHMALNELRRALPAGRLIVG